MKSFLTTTLLLAALFAARAEDPAALPLWPEGAPGALGNTPFDIPTLTPFLPAATNATGAAMVICPGGGYANLAPYEGKDYAQWLSQHGIAGFVLKYRLGSHGYHHPIELQDAARAVRWVRAHAAEYQVDVHRVGIMGSSAGGHLASTLMTHFDAGDTNAADVVERQSSRPDVGILCYAVVSMSQYPTSGSAINLLGTNAPPEVVRSVSSELQVTAQTPSAFIWCTFDDTTVPLENSLLFAEALRKHQVPFDFHIYQKGRHGLGLADKPPFAHPHPWASDCLFWLRVQGFVK